MAMPNGSETSVATLAMRSDSATAVHSSGERSNKRWFVPRTRCNVQRCTADPGPRSVGQEAGPRVCSAALRAALRPGHAPHRGCHRHHDAGVVSTLKPYFSKMSFACLLRRKARYFATSALVVLAVAATG